jgi:hypothetical protein
MVVSSLLRRSGRSRVVANRKFESVRSLVGELFPYFFPPPLIVVVLGTFWPRVFVECGYMRFSALPSNPRERITVGV